MTTTLKLRDLTQFIDFKQPERKDTPKERQIRRQTKQFNRQLAWVLSSATIGAIVALATVSPASAQFVAPTSSTVPCLGFYCGIATALNANPLITPIQDGVNAATTLVSVVFAWQFITRGAEAVRRGMNDDDWKSKASESIAVAIVGVFLFVVSYGFATAT